MRSDDDDDDDDDDDESGMLPHMTVLTSNCHISRRPSGTHIFSLWFNLSPVSTTRVDGPS